MATSIRLASEIEQWLDHFVARSGCTKACCLREITERGIENVLRSLSDHPFVAAHRELIHKIGATGGSVEARIAGAAREATCLLADVKVKVVGCTT